MTSLATPSLPAKPAPPRRIGKERSVAWRNVRERFILGLLITCGVISLAVTVSILYVLLSESITFFTKDDMIDVAGNVQDVSFWEFITGLQWNPLLGAEKHFGIWPLIVSTLMVTAIAMSVALPLGLVVAIWLSEYATPKVRGVVKPVLEIIAGIPTVVFGFFAVTFITPLLRLDLSGLLGSPSADPLNPLNIGSYNALAAGLAVGIMCIPIVTSLSEDALRAVPKALREGSYGLGASRFETSVKVVLPAALSGVIAAFLLAIARAVGETMIVALAAGVMPLPLHQMTEPSDPFPAIVVEQAAGVTDGQAAAVTPWADVGEMSPGVAVDGPSLKLEPGGTYTLRQVDIPENQRLNQVLVELAEAAEPHSVEVALYRGVSPEPVGESHNGSGGHGGKVSDAEKSRAELRDLHLDGGTYRVVVENTGDTAVLLKDLTVNGLRLLPLGERLAIPIDPRQSIQPMTGYLVQIFLGDIEHGGVEYLSSYAVAMTLFIMTLAFTLIGGVIRKRFRQAYD